MLQVILKHYIYEACIEAMFKPLIDTFNSQQKLLAHDISSLEVVRLYRIYGKSILIGSYTRHYGDGEWKEILKGEILKGEELMEPKAKGWNLNWLNRPDNQYLWDVKLKDD